MLFRSFEYSLRDISKTHGNYTTIVVITPNLMDSYIDPINKLNKNVMKTVVISLEDENVNKLNKNISIFRGEAE